jgi:hypothetical protein
LDKYEVDLTRVLVKPLYLGLLMNIFIPVVILVIAYYIDKSGGKEAMVAPESLNVIFWALAAVAVADGVVAVFLKQKLFYAPMIQTKETFEDDLAAGVFRSSLVCFAVTAAITIYGLVIYILGGTFRDLLLFVFISFIAFQLVRPRFGFLKKVIAAQERHVEQGRFRLRQI